MEGIFLNVCKMGVTMMLKKVQAAEGDGEVPTGERYRQGAAGVGTGAEHHQ